MNRFHFQALEIAAITLVIALSFDAMAFGGKKKVKVKLPKGTLLNDPYSNNIPSYKPTTHFLDLRIINHTNEDYQFEVDELVSSTEAIYNQCQGVNFKVNIISDELAKSDFTKKPLIEHKTSPNFPKKVDSFLTQFFFDLRKPYLVSDLSERKKTIDVHLIDYFTEKEKTQHKKGVLISPMQSGRAFDQYSLPSYLDSRPKGAHLHSKPNLYGANFTILAMEIYRHAKTKGFFKPDPKNTKKNLYYMANRPNSLLAHELGHILFEKTKSKPETLDHYCPGADFYCGFENVLSPGGTVEFIYKSENTKTILGFSPLPKMEPEQCELLVQHPWVQTP